jgi:CubicO group peptidase (beta-lactamase class C family)
MTTRGIPEENRSIACEVATAARISAATLTLMLALAGPAAATEPMIESTHPGPHINAPVSAPTTPSAPSISITGIPVTQMTTCDTLVTNFLSLHGIPGATFALAKAGKLKYLRAFGTANLGGTEPTQPYHLFRIASISKPITAIAIMKLVENGQLGLDDRVFGSGGLLEHHPYLSLANVTDPRIYDIRVRDLLQHAAGWNRDVDCFPNPTTPYPWPFSGCDPIVAPLHVTQTLGEPNPVSEQAMIRFLMEKGLNFAPGSAYNYSNIGYLVLGEIIETVSGLSYEAYVQANLLGPLGICDMHLGRNLLADKLEREGEYVGNGYVTLSSYGTGDYVPWEYGGFSVEAMDAHGGWIATARDLTRLLVAVDGFATKPDILSAASITTMTTPSPNNPNYALGWAVNQFNNWWHTGSLDGTASFFARSSDGYTFAIIMNKRENTDAFWSDLDALPWNCIASTASYPTHDLMAVPTQNVSGLSFSAPTETSVTVSWNPGNGNERLLVGSAGAPVSAFPLDGTPYVGLPAWGTGSTLGGGNYVLSSGTANSVTVTGLLPNTPYYFRAFELTRNATTGNYRLYQLCNSESRSITLGVPGEVQETLQLAKSATPGDLTLSWGTSCSAAAQDYGIYEGVLGSWSSHAAVDCADAGGDRTEEITPGSGDRYYLVVPNTASNDGSYGRTSGGAERPPGSPACRPVQAVAPCS